MFGFLKSKPFYKNKTREEFIEWFSKAINWNKLNSIIINAIEDAMEKQKRDAEFERMMRRR